MEQTIDRALADLHFNADGLIPCIAQQHDSSEVLMMAWMNAQAVRETLETRRVCYWSRSRRSLWRKGETSGHVQRLIDFRYDCDGDTVLLLVDQTGPACHTNRPNCFFPGGPARGHCDALRAYGGAGVAGRHTGFGRSQTVYIAGRRTDDGAATGARS